MRDGWAGGKWSLRLRGSEANQQLRPDKDVRGHAEGLLQGDVAVPGILDAADLPALAKRQIQGEEPRGDDWHVDQGEVSAVKEAAAKLGAAQDFAQGAELVDLGERGDEIGRASCRE